MKAFLVPFAFVLITAVSCNSAYHTASSGDDDVYYSSGDRSPAPLPAAPAPPVQNNSGSSGTYSDNQPDANNNQDYRYDNSNSGNYYDSTQARYSDGSGNTYITNNYYTDDDYYDYFYSSRLKRFYGPSMGFGYYDPFYTNSYWYNYNPYSWGVSIYLGYNWWAPSYYYYDPFCYGGFHHPYGYGYGGYYGNPYGYYGNPYYYNSFEPSNSSAYYYGPRTSSGGTNRREASTARNSSSSQRTASIGDRYEAAVASGRVASSRLDTRDAGGLRTTNPGGTISNRNATAPATPGRSTEVRPNPVLNQGSEGRGNNPGSTAPNGGRISGQQQNTNVDKNVENDGINLNPTLSEPRGNNANPSQPFIQQRPSNERSNFQTTRPPQQPANDNNRVREPNINRQNVNPAPQPVPNQQRPNPGMTQPKAQPQRQPQGDYHQPSYSPPKSFNYQSAPAPSRSGGNSGAAPKGNSGSSGGGRRR